jgi:hypothetical protein
MPCQCCKVKRYAPLLDEVASNARRTLPPLALPQGKKEKKKTTPAIITGPKMRLIFSHDPLPPNPWLLNIL